MNHQLALVTNSLAKARRRHRRIVQIVVGGTSSLTLDEAIPRLAKIYDDNDTLGEKALGQAYLVVSRMTPEDAKNLASLIRVDKPSKMKRVLTSTAVGAFGGAMFMLYPTWYGGFRTSGPQEALAFYGGAAAIGGLLGLVVGLAGSSMGVTDRSLVNPKDLVRSAEDTVLIQNEIDKAAVLTKATLVWQKRQQANK